MFNQSDSDVNKPLLSNFSNAPKWLGCIPRPENGCKAVLPPHQLLANVNMITLVLDTLLGVAASAHDPFDTFVQTKEALAYMPLYVLIVILATGGYTIYYSCTSPDREKPEDRFARVNMQPFAVSLFDNIKTERRQTEIRATLAVHIPTLLFSLILHISYVALLAVTDDQEPNPYVANFDWIAPVMLGLVMAISTLLTECCYVKKKEAHFEASVETYLPSL